MNRPGMPAIVNNTSTLHMQSRNQVGSTLCTTHIHDIRVFQYSFCSWKRTLRSTKENNTRISQEERRGGPENSPEPWRRNRRPPQCSEGEGEVVDAKVGLAYNRMQSHAGGRGQHSSSTKDLS